MFKTIPNVARKLGMVLASTALMATAHAGEISGAGATFPYPIYAKWAEAYKAQTDIGLNYQSIGSGGGIKQIKASTVTFGASDMPLKPEELKASDLVQFPMIIGGVVAVVNLEGIKPGELTLDGPTLASIYLGEITKWNDPKIKALNPTAKLPSQAIAPVYRADGSGTNFLFSTYLSQVSPNFQSKIGAASAVQWPVGIGAKGNEGLANMARQTGGSIGYVEYAYAKQNKLTYVRFKNKDGKVVEPDSKTFQAAASAADWAKAEGYYLVLTNQPGADSWPITGASFILMHRDVKDAGPAKEALKFFDWAYAKGDQMADQLDYVPVPDSLVKQVQETWRKSFVTGGQPLWTNK